MKILIISDTHGKDRTLEQLLKEIENLDCLIHLGDVEGSEEYIRQIAPCPVEMVAGNNDFFSDLPFEKVIELENIRIFITHGHYYGVGRGVTELEKIAREKGCEVAMYGHMHLPFLEKKDDMIILSPGSLSYPRQENRRGSYIMMESEKEGLFHYEIQYL